MQRTPVTIAALAFAGALAVPAGAADVHIGINITPPSFAFAAPPRLVVVPGHPHVHYAPEVSVNFFAYGGRYYTYDGGHWFVAHENHGPWHYVERGHVPAYVLNVPTRYYHHAPRRSIGAGHWYGSHGKGHGHGKRHWKHDGKKHGKHKGGHHHRDHDDD